VHILLLVPYYAPDLGPSAPLFTMLAEELVHRGHQVSVIAAVPHYPSGRVPDAYRTQWIQRTSENGVDVIRVRIPSVKRASLAQRMLQFICYQLGASWAGLGLKFDAAFVANPALWVWLPFVSLIALRHKPAIFSVQDVYPDVGVNLGVFKHKIVINAVAKLERSCLNHSTIVQIISESFKPGLQALGVPDTKMALVYNWVDTDLIQPLPKENAFSQEFQLQDRFVVMYAGNIGLSQGLEHVVTGAGQLADQQDIQFVFIGDGAGKDALLTHATQHNFENVHFISFQPRQRLAEVLASADVSLIMLKKGIGSGSLPSKTFSALASGRPVIASVDEGSETWNLIQRAEAGLCIPPENPGALTEAILTLRADPDLRERMGRNGRLWAEKYHSPHSAAEQIEKLLSTVISSKENRGKP
jgi:colanic acid biosynthesis glycosyl transferase WcaI